MRKVVGWGIMFLASLVATGNAQGQSLTIKPASPSVGVGQTVQFTAQVGGVAATVVWSVAGKGSGNATVGTISSTGRYTAPATPPGQNPVQITAKGATSASVFVYILSAGPAISSVSPSPLPVGTFTVTIQGTGFQPYAVVDDGVVQLVTLSVTSTTVKATGYQGPAASAVFCVKNPGSVASNTITVPVGSNSGGGTGGGGTGGGGGNPPPPTYTLTVVNGTGSGTYAAGAVVTITANAPPSGQSFLDWTGAAVQTPTASTTTLTMPASNTTVTANYATTAPSTIPYPVTTHPRLWVTQSDLPRLQSWATSTNLIYQQGILPLLNQAVSIYNTQFFPNGVPNPTYPDPGDTQGYTGYLTEQYGAVIAFNSLIDPNPANRILYARYARNMLMYAMNLAALGHLANAPFRDPMFAVYNRANGSGEQWPLIVDWIYNAKDAGGNPILTASDKATIRNVFMMWANDCLNASTTGGDHPSPIGTMNSLQLLPGNLPYRMAANNYYLGHARILTMMALSIDPTDDPPVNSALPAAQLGNTLRSYLLDATGAWLYQEFAMFGDPSVVAAAYGVPGNGAGFGLASGGLPPEGMLYGHSFGFILGQLLALQTAGFNNVSYSGPQIQMIGAPVWDRYITGYFSSLVPTAQTYSSQPWLGPVYEFASYGDLLRLWVTPDFVQPVALLALLEQETGQSTHLNAARWFAVNAVEGGPNALLSRITAPYSYSSTDSLLYFLLLDPSAAPAADPRPTFPTVFYDPPAGRIVAHSDWSSTNTMFDFRASWISINHQDGDGGQFELYRKGEWLTKEMSNYDNNGQGMTTVYHNTLALQNACTDGTPANLQWYEAGEWANGSQWMEGLDAGDPKTIMSTGPSYVYATSDLTNLFNRPDFWSPPDAAANITEANRSIVWLNNDYIVVYDRATTLNTGLFKRFNLSLVTNPAINGNVATETLPSGQQLFIQTLLPASPSTSAVYAAGNLNPIAQLEPTQYVFTVQDPSRPTDARFLHVLQGADPGASMAPATHVQSTAGTPFDGAAFATAAVFFPVNAIAAFTSTTLPIPAGAKTMLVAGLSPNTPYTVSVQSASVTITPGPGSTTDAAGLLRVTF